MKREGVRVAVDLDQVTIPDPISLQMCTLSVHVAGLEKRIKELEEQLAEKEDGKDENI